MGYARDNNFELEKDEFPKGSRVEVRRKSGWIKGTVIKSFLDNERAIEVRADKRIHDNLEYENGHGCFVFVFCRKRSEILKQIRYLTGA